MRPGCSWFDAWRRASCCSADASVAEALSTDGLRLVDGDLVAIDFDDGEHLPCLHVLPFGEGDLVDRAADARRDLHLLEGLHRPGRRHDVADRPEIDGGDLDRELHLALTAGLRRRVGRLLGAPAGGDRDGRDGAVEQDRSGRQGGDHRSSVPRGSSPIAWRSAR